MSLSTALAFGLAGCSVDTPTLTPPNQVTQQQADEASTAVSTTSQMLDLMFASASNATNMASVAAPAPGLSLDVRADATTGWTFTGPCDYNADAGRHVCETVTNGGLSLDRSYGFYDRDQAQEGFDAAVTDSINFQDHLSGTTESSAWSATVNHVGNVTVAGDPTWDFHRLWNGTGEGTLNIDYTSESVNRSYDLSSSTTVDNVSTAIPHRDNPWPLSGTFTHTFQGTATGGGSASVAYTAVVTFNGGSIVPLDLGPDAEHLDNHLCVDLNARKVVTQSCRS
jgi:hypothetical protein